MAVQSLTLCSTVALSVSRQMSKYEESSDPNDLDFLVFKVDQLHKCVVALGASDSLLEEMSSLFAGPSHGRVLQHNTKALDEDVFATVGKMIVLSVLHGGPGPVFFAEPVVEYLFGKRGEIKASIVNVPDRARYPR